MSNGFNGKSKIQNSASAFRKKISLSHAITTLTLLLSTLTATAETLTCPRASDFYPLDPGPSYFTKWNANNYTRFPRLMNSATAAYTSPYFLPTNSLTVTVTHDYPLFGSHRDTLLCNYNNGMVTVTYNTPDFILSTYGYDQVKSWPYSIGNNSHSSHACFTTAGSPEICSVDV